MSKINGGVVEQKETILNLEPPSPISMTISKYEEMLRGGFTLRDFFAGCAMIGLLKGGDACVVGDCWKAADAMLKERDK